MLLETSVKYFDSTMSGFHSLKAIVGSGLELLTKSLVDGVSLGTASGVQILNNELVLTTDFNTNALKPMCVINISGSGIADGDYKVKKLIPPNIVKCDCQLANAAITGTYQVSLPGAGWLKTQLSATTAYFKSGSLNASVCGVVVDDSHSMYMKVTASEGLDASNAPINPFQHYSPFIGKSNSSTVGSPWFIIANKEFVFIGMYTVDGYQGYRILSFGDFVSKKQNDPYRFIIEGGGYQNTSGVSLANNANDAHCFCLKGNSTIYSPKIARDYAGSVGTVNATMQAYSYAVITDQSKGINCQWSGSESNNAFLEYPNVATGSLLLSNIYFTEYPSNVLRGKLPGAYFSPLGIGAKINSDPKSLVLKDSQKAVSSGFIVCVPCYMHTQGVPCVGFIDPVGPWTN